MVERDGWKPCNKADTFDAGEQGRDGVARKSLELTEAVKQAFRVEAGRLRIENLNYVLSESPYGCEQAKVAYYKFHTAVTLVGIDPNDLLYDPQHKLKRTREQLLVENSIMGLGATWAACEYLEVDPDNLAAQTILEQGVYAPLQAHQD